MRKLIEIDVDKIKELAQNYEWIIKSIEDNNDKIIDNFNEINTIWKDENQRRFIESFNTERARIMRLENNVKQQLEIYRILEKNYKVLGRKIKCNLANKRIIEERIIHIISQLNTIIYRYNTIGDTSFYPGAFKIYNQRTQIINCRNSLENIKNSISERFQIIENIEKTISEKLKWIEIEKIVLNNYENEE